MPIEIKILVRGDEAVLTNVALGVFDHAIDPPRGAEFLSDPRHHIAVAIDSGMVVGFVSAVDYVHPDKPQPELWINEVGVGSDHRQQGLATQLLRLMMEVARKLGCNEVWVLTDRENEAAMRLYTSVGGVEAPKESVMFTFFPLAQGSSEKPVGADDAIRPNPAIYG